MNDVQGTKLFVGSLAWATDEAALTEFFGQVGTVEDAFVLKERETGRSRGCGFVTMSSVEEAQAAISELNGKELDGREINVAEAKPRD
jgi:RNA recognition motif-containing protein